MIGFIRGKLFQTGTDYVLVDVQGIGYHIQVPRRLLARLPARGEEVMLYTCLLVRDDDVSLYGFDSEQGQKIFRLLISVSGVGPRAALALLSVAEPEKLAAAIAEENLALLTSAPGVGKKTAQRIVVEVKDRMRQMTAGTPVAGVSGGEIAEQGAGEAALALQALGYSWSEARGAVVAVMQQQGTLPVADLIKAALKLLAAGKVV